MSKEMDKLILKYALQNAVKYNGKANQGAIIGKLIQEDPKVKAKLKELVPKIKQIIKDVEKLTLEEQKAKLKDIAPELLEKKKKVQQHKIPDLPNAETGKVVMRLAPYPSGPLHIGNAKPYIMNDELVKKYKGKLLLVMDDTIGSEEKNSALEAYKLIPEGLDWLGIKYDKILYKSDRVELYYEYAKKLIEKEMAYVCKCDAETMREYRRNAKVCECRRNTVQKNMDEWEKMFTEYKEGEAVLRIKTGMDHPNPAFRDRVLFRISDREHPRVGNKYRVWPLLEMSWAVDDHLLNITHILRGKELMMESMMENFIWDIFNWKKPEIIYSGLLQIKGVKISKSKSKKEVESGEYVGWDDPRSWSLQSLKRRGIKPEAVRNFIVSLGLNQNEVTVPVENLYSENRKLVDKEANRYFFIANPRLVKIKNAPRKKAKLPLHPEDEKRGSRILEAKDEFFVPEEIQKGKVYRFMHLYNFKNNEYLSEEVNPELKAKMLQWIPKGEEVKAELFMPDGSIVKGVAEKNIKNVKVDEVVQFERVGFAKLDKVENNKYYFWYTHD
ncbi:glutamate--tRNA ligase [Candidatus Woesearchaeota archaeon]|nr:MAG: glutamate--tRNA ligase [Candidatus Woesearchaeota archaeon]